MKNNLIQTVFFNAIIVAILMALVAYAFDVEAAEYSGEIAIGANVSEYMLWDTDNTGGGFDGPKDTVRFSLRSDFKNDTFVQYSHISHLSSGWPFTSEETEDWLDVVEIGVRFKF